MKVAIMQPYFLPYIGYWQMLAAVDRFVLLDDVAFIPRGWIHRNRLLVQGRVHPFTLPVSGGSQNRAIDVVERFEPAIWSARFRKTVVQEYRRAAHFDETMALLDPILNDMRGNLASFLASSITAVRQHLGIDTPVVSAAARHPSRGLKAAERIIDICEREGATEYINSPGGAALYDPAEFARHGIALHFIEPVPVPYPQPGTGFVAALSILDVLMRAGSERARAMLPSCRIRAAAAATQADA